MKSSEFYYGLPQIHWDVLAEQAEDLLRSEDIGMHIVGMYPAGDRVYGIESEPQGVLCLYVDTVESLLNPTFITNSNYGFDIFHVGETRKPIIMINLFDWVKSLANRSFNSLNSYLINLIPIFSDPIFQDEGVEYILELCSFLVYDNHNSYPTEDRNDLYKNYLMHRADAIFSIANLFHPCINPEWFDVISLEEINAPKEIVISDCKIIDYLVNNGKEPSAGEVNHVTMWLVAQSKKAKYKCKWNRELENKIGSEVSKFYRSLV